MREVWRDIADMTPLESDNKLVTYHSWFACPLQESLCISVTASQSLKGAQNIRSPRCFSPRHQLQICMKGLLKSGTIRGKEKKRLR